LSFWPFRVGKTRSVGSVNGERSSQSASSSRSDHRERSLREVEVATLERQGLLDPEARAGERREHRAAPAREERLLSARRIEQARKGLATLPSLSPLERVSAFAERRIDSV
jgi:hypothetical protein